MPKILQSITSALTAALSSSGYWLLLALVVLLLARPSWGNGQQDSFRISRIETELRSLRSQISQLEGQVSRLQRREGVASPAVSAAAPRPTTAPAPSYDQLATLVIETRQDMFTLETRLNRLEGELRGTSPEGTP